MLLLILAHHIHHCLDLSIKSSRAQVYAKVGVLPRDLMELYQLVHWRIWALDLRWLRSPAPVDGQNPTTQSHHKSGVFLSY